MANAELSNHIDVRWNLFCLNSVQNIVYVNLNRLSSMYSKWVSAWVRLGDLRRISSPGLESFLKINRMDIAINNILNEKNIYFGVWDGFFITWSKEAFISVPFRCIDFFSELLLWSVNFHSI